ncbi:hypothetical protein Tco_0513925 [Tanacetum coccineum]
MIGDCSRLKNFMKKFIGTVRFGNDHSGAIMGYGDYVIGDSVISRVYYVEGLGHNLFYVRQFCDSDLEVAFRKHLCYVRDTDGVELIKDNYDNESSDDDNDDDDVEKDEEDGEEKEHLASGTPSDYLQMIRSPQDKYRADETDESASTSPTSPHHIILSFETKSRAVRMNQGHCRSDCSERKNRNHENQTRGAGARGALARFQAVIVCAEKIVRIPWGNETLIIHGDGSNQGNVTRLNIISCTKTQKYMEKGFSIFLAHVTAKEVEDKSEKKRLEDVPIVRDFPKVFLEDLSGLPPTRQVESCLSRRRMDHSGCMDYRIKQTNSEEPDIPLHRIEFEKNIPKTKPVINLYLTKLIMSGSQDDIPPPPPSPFHTEQGTKKRKGGHMKMLARKKKRPQSDVDSDDEHRKCLKIVTFEGTIYSEIMERKSVIARLNKYSKITLEGIELILWGDLKIMMESSTEENDQSDFWNDQQDWEIVTWRLYEACGVYILELKDETVIHMLVERRYPLSKDLLQRMFDLGLEVERESTAALDLIRFIEQQIDEK